MITCWVAMTNHGGVIVDTKVFGKYDSALDYLQMTCKLSESETMELIENDYIELENGDNTVLIEECVIQ